MPGPRPSSVGTETAAEVPDGGRDGGPAGGALDLRAETVRDYLVALRGGAPFLSAADDRLLLAWLEAGLPVARILAAVDQVAEVRRRQQSRRRLTLSACKKAVENEETASVAAGEPAREGPDRGPGAGLAALATEIEGSVVSPELAPALRELVAELRGLATAPGASAGGDRHTDELGRAAAAAIGRFHSVAWEAAAPLHASLVAQAEVRLAPMRALLRGREWEALVEETARDLLRQQTPAVSARAVWDRLGA